MDILEKNTYPFRSVILFFCLKTLSFSGHKKSILCQSDKLHFSFLVVLNLAFG